jgi:hypothetical protein
MATQRFEKPSYERMLSVVGAWLDDLGAIGFNLMETPDGFVLAADLVAYATLPESRELTYANLKDLELEYGKRRRSSKQSPSALTPEGRDHFFRALGYELDAAAAHSILMDELEAELLLTYSYIDASQGYLWRKRMVTIDAENVREILVAERSRERSHSKGLLGFLR